MRLKLNGSMMIDGCELEFNSLNIDIEDKVVHSYEDISGSNSRNYDDGAYGSFEDMLSEIEDDICDECFMEEADLYIEDAIDYYAEQIFFNDKTLEEVRIIIKMLLQEITDY